MNWKEISHDEQISEDFVREHADKLYWKYLSINPSVSESLLKELDHYIQDWTILSTYRKLSEDFLYKRTDVLYFLGTFRV